jgi:hypothetical protein
VESHCGSLPCPPYVQGYELTCAVCTKWNGDDEKRNSFMITELETLWDSFFRLS